MTPRKDNLITVLSKTETMDRRQGDNISVLDVERESFREIPGKNQRIQVKGLKIQPTPVWF